MEDFVLSLVVTGAVAFVMLSTVTSVKAGPLVLFAPGAAGALVTGGSEGGLLGAGLGTAFLLGISGIH